jgi:hypothetical protein
MAANKGFNQARLSEMVLANNGDMTAFCADNPNIDHFRLLAKKYSDVAVAAFTARRGIPEDMCHMAYVIVSILLLSGYMGPLFYSHDPSSPSQRKNSLWKKQQTKEGKLVDMPDLQTFFKVINEAANGMQDQFTKLFDGGSGFPNFPACKRIDISTVTYSTSAKYFPVCVSATDYEKIPAEFIEQRSVSFKWKNAFMGLMHIIDTLVSAKSTSVDAFTYNSKMFKKTTLNAKNADCEDQDNEGSDADQDARSESIAGVSFPAHEEGTLSAASVCHAAPASSATNSYTATDVMYPAEEGTWTYEPMDGLFASPSKRHRKEPNGGHAHASVDVHAQAPVTAPVASHVASHVTSHARTVSRLFAPTPHIAQGCTHVVCTKSAPAPGTGVHLVDRLIESYASFRSAFMCLSALGQADLCSPQAQEASTVIDRHIQEMVVFANHLVVSYASVPCVSNATNTIYEQTMSMTEFLVPRSLPYRVDGAYTRIRQSANALISVVKKLREGMISAEFASATPTIIVPGDGDWVEIVEENHSDLVTATLIHRNSYILHC